MRYEFPEFFLNFLFPMDEAQVVSVIGFENQFFRVRVNGMGFSSGLFEYGIFLSLFAFPDILVDLPSFYLKMPSDLRKRLPVQPMLDDSLNIPIG